MPITFREVAEVEAGDGDSTEAIKEWGEPDRRPSDKGEPTG